ncbi:MAG: HAD family hydrolase [Alphaproteobacteria bacterium]|nr:HAD family hydrolase [Alphaproteobacteria bacterium]
MTIRAIIWDFGGVLTSSPFEAFNRHELANGIPADFIRSVNARNPDTNAWAQFERSELTLDQFDVLFAEESAALGHEIAGRDVISLLGGEVRPMMAEALRRCSLRYKVGCITNNVPAGRGPGMVLDNAAANAVRDVMKMFHHIIESKRAGIRKPDPRIYQMSCDALGVHPREAIYLDDLGVNLKPARALGMQTIKVGEPEIALAELEALLGHPLRD